MSLPRQVIPGTTYLLTRRCSQRQFLLRPSEEINHILLYCLAVAAARYHLLIHAFCFLSNHYHLVATDPEGRLPAFMHWLNEYSAKCINAHYGRWESIWAPGSYSSVRLIEPNDILGAMVYVYANPIAAGLVRDGDAWPGLRSRPEDIEQTVFSVTRPSVFFRATGKAPERASLRLELPALSRETDTEPLATRLRALVTEKEEAIRLEHFRERRAFLGPKKVLSLSPFDSPVTREARREGNPRIACRNRKRRMEVLHLWRGFINAYIEARDRFFRGERDIVFPYGTYWMRIKFGVACAGGTL